MSYLEGGFYTEPFSTKINDLPAEVVLKIYSGLSTNVDKMGFMLTCKKWYEISVSDIWRRPDITDEKTLLQICATLNSPTQSQPFASYIKRLNLTQVNMLITDLVLGFFYECTNLERLVLLGAKALSSEAIEGMLRRNPSLISVDLSNLDAVTDLTISRLSVACSRLQGLYISNCHNVTDLGVGSLARNITGLKRIRLTDCKAVTGASLTLLVCRCPNIVELDLTLSDPSAAGTLSDAAFLNIANRLEYLRDLRLVGQTQLTNDSFDPAYGAHFRFGHSRAFWWLENLRLLDLTSCSYISDAAISNIVTSAPRLHHIALGRCYHITDASLRSLSSLGPSLHFLHLGHCNRITDLGVEYIAKSCVKLQYIDLANCSLISNHTLFLLSGLQRLRRIGLVKCALISDYGLESIYSRNWRDDPLERIHLSYCGLITEYGVSGLLNACPRLMHLSLTGVQSFIKPEITHFCRSPPSDLNEHQRAVFCVFSGQGVSGLREYLRKSLA